MVKKRLSHEERAIRMGGYDLGELVGRAFSSELRGDHEIDLHYLAGRIAGTPEDVLAAACKSLLWGNRQDLVDWMYQLKTDGPCTPEIVNR